MKYSICTTNYNTEDVIEDHLNSIIPLIDEQNYEIIIVDNKSKDRSPQIIKEFSDQYKNIKLISARCSRGKGRQIAFENSNGDYILQTDCDTIYRPVWKEFIEKYEKNNIDICIQAHYFGIYPRRILNKIGGWKDLNYAEDIELWMRLLKINSFKWSLLVLGDNNKRKVHQNIIEKYHRKYYLLRDIMFIPCYDKKYLHEQFFEKKNTIIKYLFWEMLLNISYLSFSFKAKKMKTDDLEFSMKIYLNNIIDVGIESETKHWWENIPEGIPID